MAAGISVLKSRFAELKDCLEQYTTARLNGDAFSRPITIEASAAFADLKPSLHHEIRLLAPFGVGNREPLLLSKEVEVVRAETFGADRRHLRLQLRDRTASAEAIAFDKAGAAPHLPRGRRIDGAYAMQMERWGAPDGARLHPRVRFAAARAAPALAAV